MLIHTQQWVNSLKQPYLLFTVSGHSKSSSECNIAGPKYFKPFYLRLSFDPSAQPSFQPSPKQLFLGGRTTERGVINTPPLPSTQFFVIANKRSRLDVIGQANWVCLASSKSQLNLKICDIMLGPILDINYLNSIFNRCTFNLKLHKIHLGHQGKIECFTNIIFQYRFRECVSGFLNSAKKPEKRDKGSTAEIKDSRTRAPGH